MAGAEQPAVHLLTLLDAGRKHLAQGCLRMLLQITQQPQLQRMHLGDIALIIQIEAARGVIPIQSFDALGGLRHPHVLLDKGAESGQIGLRIQLPMHHRQPRGDRLYLFQQPGEALRFIQTGMTPPELLQIDAPFPVGEGLQIGLTARIAVVAQQAVGILHLLVQAVAHHIAQQPHIGQVDRLLQRLLHADPAPVILLAEVAEALHPAAGKELLMGRSGIAPLQRRLQHLLKRRLGLAAQVVCGPQGQRITAPGAGRLQGLGISTGQLAVQLGNDLQIAGQHPQLGSRAQLQLAAGVQVERQTVGISLHPYLVAVRRALHQGKAVAHLGRLLRGQQTFAEQPGLGRCRIIGQRFKKIPHLALQPGIQGALHLQVQSIQRIGRLPEQAHQLVAGNPDALVGGGRLQQRLLLPVAKLHSSRQCGPGQLGIDPLMGGQQPHVTVHQPLQLPSPVKQIPARAALGDHQRQCLAQRHSLGMQALLTVEPVAELLDILGKPGPQRIAHTMHLTMPRGRRQRHGIEVVAHQLLAGLQGIRAVHIGAHGGGGHLPQLVHGRLGAALQRVAVLLHLRGQGTGTMARTAAAKAADQHAHRRPGQPWPVHRRVGPGQGRIEQVTVLDKQQGINQQRRNIIKLGIAEARISELVDHLAPGIGHLQSGVGLFRVGQEQSVPGIIEQLIGKARLTYNSKTLALQRRLQLRDQAVTQPLVERPRLGKADSLALTIAQLVMKPVGVLTDPAGLEPGITELEADQANQCQRQETQNQPDTQPHDSPSTLVHFKSS